MHPRLWAILHAPPRPSDDHLWCDVCDSWRRRTMRVMPFLNDAGLVARPSFRVCPRCAALNWEGSAAERERWTIETKAREQAYLALITDEQVEAKIAELVAQIQQRVRLPGFRQGHVPAARIRADYSEILIVEAMEDLLIEALRKAAGPVEHDRQRAPTTQEPAVAHCQDAAHPAARPDDSRSIRQLDGPPAAAR